MDSSTLARSNLASGFFGSALIATCGSCSVWRQTHSHDRTTLDGESELMHCCSMMGNASSVHEAITTAARQKACICYRGGSWSRLRPF